MASHNNTSPSCYLCGSASCTQIHDRIRYDLSPRPFRCDNCGFIFIHPRMSHEEGQEFYEKIYRFAYADEKPEDQWIESLPEAKKRVTRFQDLLHNDVHLLEIGCASGFFLSEVQKKVKSVTGAELTKEYVHYAITKGLDVRESLDEIEE